MEENLNNELFNENFVEDVYNLDEISSPNHLTGDQLICMINSNTDSGDLML